MMGNYCETIPPKSVTATIFFTFTAERRSKMTIEVMNNEEKEMILFWLKKNIFYLVFSSQLNCEKEAKLPFLSCFMLQ